MSWIIRDLWATLDARKDEYASLLDNNKILAYGTISRIAGQVGQRYGVVLQLNFPPGRYSPRLEGLARRDLSILAHRGREKFDHVSETEVKRVFERLKPLGFELLKRGQEGFKALLKDGRIDCLPGGVHLWCELTPDVLGVLDWLFTNAYGLTPT